MLYKQAVMMTLSMITAVFLYAGIGFYAVQTGHPASAAIQGGTYRAFQLGAFFLSVLAVIGSRFLSNRMLSVRAATAPAERHPKQLFVTAILHCTAAELPVLFGLVLLFLSRDISGFLPFAVFSLAALAFSFPNKQKWTEWLGADF